MLSPVNSTQRKVIPQMWRMSVLKEGLKRKKCKPELKRVIVMLRECGEKREREE